MPDAAYMAVEVLLRFVDTLGRRNRTGGPPVLPDDQFPWLRTLSDRCNEIRLEAMELANRLDSVDACALTDLPVGVDGQWRLIPLVDRRGVYPYTGDVPITMSVLRAIPSIRAADFAILTSGSRIHPHVGNNWGVLRTHLTLIEAPGRGACHLHFPKAGVTREWRTATTFVFDDTHLHEAVNYRAGDRMVLLAEFDRPMPPIARLANRLAQRMYRYHPVQRGVRARVLARLHRC
jgi:beta-hydroxylase